MSKCSTFEVVISSDLNFEKSIAETNVDGRIIVAVDLFVDGSRGMSAP